MGTVMNESKQPGRLIVALDVNSMDAAMSLIDTIGDAVDFYKVGLELFSTAGPDAVRMVRSKNKHVFLDLKLHDIPNTVSSAALACADLGADFLTCHALGGPKMIETAVCRLDEDRLGSGPRLLAVTILTSMDEDSLQRVGICEKAGEAVPKLASMAVKAGAHGIVCSPLEASRVRKAIGPGPVIVCPGIRPAGADTGDQKRVSTPDMAIKAGADYLVVGRPVRLADDPAHVAEEIIKQIEQSMTGDQVHG